MITVLQTVSSSKVELLVRLLAEHISFIEYLFKYNDFLENEPKFTLACQEKASVVTYATSLCILAEFMYLPPKKTKNKK